MIHFLFLLWMNLSVIVYTNSVLDSENLEETAVCCLLRYFCVQKLVKNFNDFSAISRLLFKYTLWLWWYECEVWKQ